MSIYQDLRYVLRRLRRNPTFVAIVVLVLAIGIGASTAVFSFVDALVLEPLPFEQSANLYRILGTDAYYDWEDAPLTWPDYVDIKEQSRSFEAIAGLRGRGFNLASTGQPVRVSGAEVTSSLFRLMRIEAALGRTFTAEEERSGERVAVLSEDLWKLHFGSSNILNGTVVLDGLPYTVIGIMPSTFQVPSRDTSIWVPLEVTEQMKNRRRYELTALVRLQSGSSAAQAREDLEAVAQRLATTYSETNRTRGFRLVSFYELIYGEGFSQAITIFILAVLFVHLIAVSNVANMLMAKALAHEQEFAVRASLGAGRMQLTRLFVMETMALCIAGAVFGLLFGFWGVRYLKSVLPGNIPRLDAVVIDERVLLFTVLLSLVTGVVFGLVPALLMKAPNLAGLMKEQERSSQGGGRRKRIRQTLVVAEMALSFVLLITATLLIRSFQNLQEVDPGFERKDLLIFKVSLTDVEPLENEDARREIVSQRFAQLLAGVQSVAGVERATFASVMPGESAPGIRYVVAGQDVAQEGLEPVADFMTVGPEYFQTLMVSVLRGRTFGPTDTFEGQRVVIVNESLARLHFGSEDPLRQKLQIADGVWQVVGVVSDFQQGGLEDPVNPTIYFSFRQRREIPTAVTFAVRSAVKDPLLLSNPIQNVVTGVAPGIPIYGVKTMEKILTEDIAGTGVMAQLLFGFAVVANILALAGIYGVMSYAVSRRWHEMGVRIALGAARRDIVGIILREGVGLAALGILLGAGGAFVVTRLLGNWLHGLGAYDGLTFLTAAVLQGAMGVFGSLTPARRAIRVKPSLLLHAE